MSGKQLSKLMMDYMSSWLSLMALNIPPYLHEAHEAHERDPLGFHWKICIVYLDDNLMYNRTKEEHLRFLRLVL